MSIREIKLSDIIQKQAIINISTAGHVSHGKSTIIRKLTGIKTQRYSSEKKNAGKTIHLGYANAKIYYCPKTGLFQSVPSTTTSFCHPETGDEMKLVKHISLVDCPGHDEYMATMVGGTSVADITILVIAGNESVPQPQTYEHILALSASNINKFLILHNKLDLLTQEQTKNSIKEINGFLEGSPIEGSTIVPISAERGYNVEHVCRYLCFNVDNSIERDYKAPARMTIVRSFGVNKPSTNVKEMLGGVVGGTINRGVLAIGDHVELRPGILKKSTKTGQVVVQPLVAEIIHLKSEHYDLEQAISGGLVGVGLSIDSGLASSGKLVGFQLGHVGTMDPIVNVITGRVTMMKSMTEKHSKLSINEDIFVVASGSMVMNAIVTSKDKKTYTLKTKLPVTLAVGDKIAIMRGNRLVATMKVMDASCTYEIEYPEGFDSFNEWERPVWTVIDDIHDILTGSDHADVAELLAKKEEHAFDYDELVSNVIYKTDKVDVVTIPEIKMSYENRTTHIKNIEEIISKFDHSALLRDTDSKNILDMNILLLNYFKSEITDQARYNGSTPMHLILDRRRKAGAINQMFLKFGSIFRCPTCKSSYKTVIYRQYKEKLYFRECLSCSATTTTPVLF